jgi:hypothetical protein
MPSLVCLALAGGGGGHVGLLRCWCTQSMIDQNYLGLLGAGGRPAGVLIPLRSANWAGRHLECAKSKIGGRKTKFVSKCTLAPQQCTLAPQPSLCC